MSTGHIFLVAVISNHAHCQKYVRITSVVTSEYGKPYSGVAGLAVESNSFYAFEFQVCKYCLEFSEALRSAAVWREHDFRFLNIHLICNHFQHLRYGRVAMC